MGQARVQGQARVHMYSQGGWDSLRCMRERGTIMMCGEGRRPWSRLRWRQSLGPGLRSGVYERWGYGREGRLPWRALRFAGRSASEDLEIRSGRKGWARVGFSGRARVRAGGGVRRERRGAAVAYGREGRRHWRA